MTSQQSLTTAAAGGRGDADDVLARATVTMTTMATTTAQQQQPAVADLLTTALDAGAVLASDWRQFPGTRGATWTWCSAWYSAMPGSLFQLGCVMLYLAFLGGGGTASATIYSNALYALAFVAWAAWAAVDVCCADIVAWSVVLAVVNVAHVVYATYQTHKTQKALEGDAAVIYHTLFAPFDVSKELFSELVSLKGFQIITLAKDHCYAIEHKTTVDRLGLLAAGKLRVHNGNRFLHFVNKNEFIDSSEWEAIRTTNKKGTVFRVTLTADTTCRCIVWKRKPLLALLAKEKKLNRIFNFMIGRDIVKKLYALNARRFNERGFHYDIRLPCVMSLRDEVNDRAQKRMQQHLASPKTPGGRRQRKLGKRAAQDYANMFARRMSQRIGRIGTRRLNPPAASSSHDD